MPNALNDHPPPWVFVLGFTVLMLASLVWGVFDSFFFGSDGQTLQGVDFFSTPKAFLNLLEGRSMYDSWEGAPFGPSRTTTWYLMHPAFTILVASWPSWFSPWTGYWVFTFVALALLAASASVIASLTPDRFEKQMAFVFFLCSFVTYWLLYVGNMHSITVVSFTLLLAGLYELSYGDAGAEDGPTPAVRKVAAGLLLSLLSKPVLLLALPALLFNKATRKVSLQCLAVYGVVSLVFLLVPVLNPESIGPAKMIELAIDPAYVRQHLDVYANNFVLNEYMKDNSIHWLNIVAQSGASRNHIDNFSLSAFVSSGLGVAVPGLVFQGPVLLVLLFSAGLLFVGDERERPRISLLVVMAGAFSYFLSYNAVWEYQYALLFPCFALLFLMYRRRQVDRRAALAILGLAVFFYLPSPYVLVRPAMTFADINWIRSTKVVPSLICFLLLAWVIVARIRVQVTGRGRGSCAINSTTTDRVGATSS